MLGPTGVDLLQGFSEEAMVDSKFWLRTEKKFRRLQVPPPQPGEVQQAWHNGLCAWWTPDGSPDRGTYDFFDDGYDIEANGNIQRMFQMVAESAGVELGYPDGEAAVFAWLDRLRLAGLYVKPFVEGSQIIHRVCDASAEYCLKCETDVKAAARERESSTAPLPIVQAPVSPPGERRPGPKRDTETAQRVLEVIKRVGSKRWMDDLDKICAALDDEEIPFPKTWPRREIALRNWSDGASLEPGIAKKAIEHHLKNAKF